MPIEASTMPVPAWPRVRVPVGEAAALLAVLLGAALLLFAATVR